jgi:UDP-N-acetyl-D-mannosaminouronate:lipid I N-acetyl-D-mannosaminouronosyltransferase
MHNIVKFAGLDISAFDTLDAMARYVLPDTGSVTSAVAVAINPEKIMTARGDPATRRVLDEATLRYPDGIGVVWALRRKGYPVSRIPGADLWEHLMARAASLGKPVFLLGARPEVLQQTVKKLRDSFPAISIGAALDGYADQEARAGFARAVKAAGGGIVAVAMGSPRQEKVIMELRQSCPEAFYMGVGGTFDCYVGAVTRAPAVWQGMHLEWLYRLVKQPSRIKRQWKYLPYALLVLSGRL